MSYNRTADRICSSLRIDSLPGVTLHCSEQIPSLGERSYDLLTRFKDRASAKVLFDTLGKTLETLGLSIRDFRGITTDAASVMQKLGRLIKKAVQRSPQDTIEAEEEAEPGLGKSGEVPFFHMLCMAHGLHLAVLDTFKQSRTVEKKQPETEEEEMASWNFVGIDRGKVLPLPVDIDSA